jgi:hypothetical protein
MKITSLLSAAALLICSLVAAPLQAQDPVHTGTVISVSPDQGTLTLRRTETGTPVVYYGMKVANIMMNDGKVATIGNVTPGMMATVFYKLQGNQMFVSKMLIQEGDGSTTGNASGTAATAPASVPAASGAAAPVPAAGLTPGTAAGLTSKAARDGDITTQPGSKAATDRDITTQPGSKAATDNDITTQPAHSGKGGAVRNSPNGR